MSIYSSTQLSGRASLFLPNGHHPPSALSSVSFLSACSYLLAAYSVVQGDFASDAFPFLCTRLVDDEIGSRSRLSPSLRGSMAHLAGACGNEISLGYVKDALTKSRR